VDSLPEAIDGKKNPTSQLHLSSLDLCHRSAGPTESFEQTLWCFKFQHAFVRARKLLVAPLVPLASLIMSVEGPNVVPKQMASRQWSAETLQNGMNAVLSDVKCEPWMESTDEELKDRLKAGFMSLESITFTAIIMSSSSNQRIKILEPVYIF